MLYNNGDLMIRESTHEDILPIAFNMRHADVEEIWASHNATPLEALNRGIMFSKPCLTALWKEKPVAMFGVTPMKAGNAIVWFLGTDVVDKHRVCFCKMSRFIMKKFYEIYPTMYNWVDVRNTKSIEWLKWLGAKFDSACEYGSEQLMFNHFVLRRK